MKPRPAFTLIETVISLSIMAILFLGLSGAVLIGSHAIPTATQTGIADQTVIDALQKFRSEARQATTIQLQSGAQGHQLTFDLKATGAPGAPSRVRYRYLKDSQTFLRLEIGRAEEILFDNITKFDINITQDGSDATILWIIIVIDDTIQQFFEIHVALPDKPEAV